MGLPPLLQGARELTKGFSSFLAFGHLGVLLPSLSNEGCTGTKTCSVRHYLSTGQLLGKFRGT